MNQNNKITLLIFIVLLSVCCGGITAKKAEANSKESVPEGYKAIRTIADLRDINNNTSGNYILMNDIDLTEATKEGGSYDTGNGWTPLNTFSGILDGNGYRIRGMHIYGEISQKIGLFKELSGATVKNLGMVDCDIDIVTMWNLEYIGSIAGYVKDYSEITNCFSTGTISTYKTSSVGYLGGLVGEMNYFDSLISNCYSTVKLQSFDGSHDRAISGGRSYNCYFAGSTTQDEVYLSSSPWGEPSCYYLVGSMKLDGFANALTHEQMRSKSSFLGWDFNDTWVIDPYSYYQYPQLRNALQTKIKKMEMVSLPTKTTYVQGENISIEGAVVELIYEDGTSATVSVDNTFQVEYDDLKIGEQNVTVSYLNGSTTFPVTFTGYEITDIELSATATNVAFGNTIQFSAITKPEQALDNKLTWNIKDKDGNVVPENDALITENGLFMGNKMGTYVVTATANNGVSKSYTVTVTRPMVYLIADPEEISIECDESATINLKQSPLDSTEDIIWKSSNNEIAVVENGVIMAKKPGKVVITAKTKSCDAARCVVTVVQDISKCEVSGLTTQIYTGKNIKLKKLKVFSNNGKLREGVDYSVKYKNNRNIGTAMVTIEGKGFFRGTLSKTFEIILGDIQKAKISNSFISLYQKQNKKLTINGAAGYEVKWSSQSKKIARVNANGIVTAKKPGKTYIFAKVEDKLFKCKVTVKKR